MAMSHNSPRRIRRPSSGRAAWCGSRLGNDLEIDSNRRTKYQKTSVTSRCPALDPTSTTDRVQVPAYDAAGRLLNHGDMSGLRDDEFGRLAPLPDVASSVAATGNVTNTYLVNDLVRSRQGRDPARIPTWTLDPGPAGAPAFQWG
jgi:hypothetical protein